MKLVAHNLQKKYADFEAVKSFTFELNPGEVLGLLGPNGAGKSTIIGMLYGAVIPSSGDIEFDSKSLLNSNNLRKAKVSFGVVTQENSLDPDLSVLENLLVFARYYGMPSKAAKQRAHELLELTNLVSKKDVNVEALSGGMKRKLILARAIIASPKILFLDEPTTGLDPDARQELWKLVSLLKAQGVGVLLTTHYMDEAERLCDRIILLQAGSILDEGSPEALTEQTIGKEVAEIYGCDPELLEDFCVKHNLWFRSFADGFLIQLPALDNSPLKLQLAKLTSKSLLYRKTNLEDVFLKLTGERLN